MKDRNIERGKNSDKENHATAKGAVTGGVAGGVAGGALTGALAGGVTGPVGAAIGAAAGAVVGALAGKAKDDTQAPGSEDAASDEGRSAKGALAGGAVGGVTAGAVTGGLAGGVTGPVGAAIGAAAGAGAGALAGKSGSDRDTTVDAEAREPAQSPSVRATSGDVGVDTASASRSPSAEEDRGVIPVVQEELEVGKRTVKAGGVRVESRLVEDTVHESVNLREERATIERRPVDRPASEADLQGLGSRSIEVEETVERPVVQKTARVVEEVAVGKDVRQQQADIEETVRHTEVDVQPLAGAQRGRDYGEFEQEFRSDCSTRFAGTGRRYEDTEPAYRFGHSMASDGRYRGRQWEDVEADAKSDWARSNDAGTWEDVKGAVRHGWQRAGS